MSEACPKCGSQDVTTRTRQGKAQTWLGLTPVVDVGWGCEACGHEWGFEVFKEPTEEVR